MSEFDEVLRLIAEDDLPPDVRWGPTGATAADLRRLRDDLGFEPPAVLIRWLSVCNGSLAGQGGLLGANLTGRREHLDISFHLDLWPGWRERRWIPIAGDGCGDFYVLDASHSHFSGDAIFFVDQADYDALDYAVASGLPIFLRQHLRTYLDWHPEQDQALQWPFDRAVTLAIDPRLAEVRTQRLLPWSL